MVVSVSHAHRSIEKIGQMTWIIELAEIEQQVLNGKESKEVLAQLISGMDISS